MPVLHYAGSVLWRLRTKMALYCGEPQNEDFCTEAVPHYGSSARYERLCTKAARYYGGSALRAALYYERLCTMSGSALRPGAASVLRRLCSMCVALRGSVLWRHLRTQAVYTGHINTEPLMQGRGATAGTPSLGTGLDCVATLRPSLCVHATVQRPSPLAWLLYVQTLTLSMTPIKNWVRLRK